MHIESRIILSVSFRKSRGKYFLENFQAVSLIQTGLPGRNMPSNW
jgi:hypothetical protein